jgi:hypothetical protein
MENTGKPLSVISPPGFGKYFGKLVVPITDT